MVAKGFAQKYDIDYEETFTPVAKMSTMRIILALSAAQGWKVFQLDIKSAFLNGDLDVEIFMNQPEGFVVKGKESFICKLKKSLYGLKQAPRAWYTKILRYFANIGFSKCFSDFDLYVLNQGKDVVLILLYVDDLLITGNNDEIIQECISKLKATFEMIDLDLLHYYLEMQVYQYDDCTYLSQSKYISDILQKFGMEECRYVTILVSLGITVSLSSNSQLADATTYRQLIRSLLFLNLSRLDITFAVNLMARFIQKPYVEHLNAVKQILRYVAGTKDLALKYSRLPLIFLSRYTDSDYGGDRYDKKSTSAYVFSIGLGAISWASKKQPTISLSITEAEYRAISIAAQEAIWLRHLLKEIGYEQSGSSLICSDNQSAISLAKNPMFHQRTKHVEIHAHFITNPLSKA